MKKQNNFQNKSWYFFRKNKNLSKEFCFFKFFRKNDISFERTRIFRKNFASSNSFKKFRNTTCLYESWMKNEKQNNFQNLQELILLSKGCKIMELFRRNVWRNTTYLYESWLISRLSIINNFIIWKLLFSIHDHIIFGLEPGPVEGGYSAWNSHRRQGEKRRRRCLILTTFFGFGRPVSDFNRNSPII